MAFEELTTSAKKEEKKNYEIIKVLAEVGEPDDKGMQTKITITKWFNNDPKYDIRKWRVSGNGKKDCSSGYTASSAEEMKALTEALVKLMEV